MRPLTAVLYTFCINTLVYFICVLIHYIYYSGVFFYDFNYTYDLPIIILICILGALSIYVIHFHGSLIKNPYFILLGGSLILILQIWGLISGATTLKDDEKLKSLLNNAFITIELYDRSDIAKKYWDSLQYKKCCGINGYKDWSKYGDGEIPYSCCKSFISNDQLKCNPSDVYSNGCMQFYIDGLQTLNILHIVFTCLIIVIQIVGIVVNLYIIEILPLRRFNFFNRRDYSSELNLELQNRRTILRATERTTLL